MRAYANEAELQALIAESPELVSDLKHRPGVAIRERALPDAGYRDVLIVHLNGELTLIEAKLSRNPEIRRAVVGQLLGYAGGLWRLDYERLDSVVKGRTGQATRRARSGSSGCRTVRPRRFPPRSHAQPPRGDVPARLRR